jgi:hypothetical protein
MARFQHIFFAIGFAMLAVWGIAALDNIIFSHAALAKFDANQATRADSSALASHGPASGYEVVFSLLG